MRFDFLETSDPVLISELESCARNAIGGVMVITKEEYDAEIKKKETLKQSNGNSNPHRGRTELSALLGPRVAEVVNRGGGFNPSGMFARPQEPQVSMNKVQPNRPMPDPIEVPTAESFKGSFIVKPPVGKVT